MANEKKFNPDKEITHIINHIKDYFSDNGDKNTIAVIGISGGKDSTVATALLVKALGPDKVFGVLMPDGEQKDIADAYEVCKIFNIPHITVNIGDITKSLYTNVKEGFKDGGVGRLLSLFDTGSSLENNPAVITNTPSRIRMSILYAVAAQLHGRVINTGNASEAYVGYTTKYGDLAGDYAVLAGYYVREIYQIGDALGIPAGLLYKAPSDGMSDKTDADNLGFSYDVLDSYLIDGKFPTIETLNNIKERYNRNKHKQVIQLPYPGAITRVYSYKGNEWSF